MKNVFLLMCICLLCSPVLAQDVAGDWARTIAITDSMPYTPSEYDVDKAVAKLRAKAEKKKHKAENLSNGNIVVGGKEYAPVIKTSEAK
jgi:hypothetical protein